MWRIILTIGLAILTKANFDFGFAITKVGGRPSYTIQSKGYYGLVQYSVVGSLPDGFEFFGNTISTNKNVKPGKYTMVIKGTDSN